MHKADMIPKDAIILYVFIHINKQVIFEKVSI